MLDINPAEISMTDIRTEIKFLEPDKQLTYERSKDKIKHRIEEIKKIDNHQLDQSLMIFGNTFEIMASEENRQKYQEIGTQKDIRELIENIYQKAELILGTTHERPSKPDGVSVIMDENGKLIINEIVEIKSSNNAFLHGVDANQPEKTLQTINEVVRLLNRLIKGEKTVDIKPKNADLSFENRVKRDVELTKIQQKIILLAKDRGTISFSPEMVYKIIIPNGETIPSFNPDLLKELGYLSTTLEINHSRFSKKDVHHVIDQLS